MKPIHYLSLAAFAALFMTACGPAAITLPPIENISGTIVKNVKPTTEELKTWQHADPVKDSLPGMSVHRAYAEILNERKAGEKVVMAFIGSGIDIEHEDLKNIIWTNEDEIPDNEIDDDNNGYVDDIRGWNFLGDATHENLEFVRIIKKGDEESDAYKKAKAEYNKERYQAEENKKNWENVSRNINMADAVIKSELGKESYTKEDLNTIKTQNQRTMQLVNYAKRILSSVDSIPEAKRQVRVMIDRSRDQMNYNLNEKFNGRTTGDDPDDLNDKDYGDNKVMGPDKETTATGTGVVGIAVAERNNAIGMDGIASNVEVMVLRAVPDGDEYDKDVALAIRYAADNGAKVINISFNKYYSPHPDWVHDAIKYAESKDVLIVNTSGFNGHNIDEINAFPNDATGIDPEIADNFLTVGGLHFEYGEKLVANSSDYGKYNVDVFAPGNSIWSIGTGNNYGFIGGGASAAAAAVSGVAAVIRSHFPKLTASQVKRIIMDSGLPYEGEVILGGKPGDRALFSDISVSGKMVNLYNALIMADKVSRGK